MSRSLEVDLVLKLRDLAGNNLDKFHRELQQQLKATAKDAQATGLAMDALGKAEGPTRFAAALARVQSAAQATRTALEGMLNVGKQIGQITASIGAAGYVVGKPTMAAADYTHRLNNVINTAYSDRDAAGRKTQRGTVDAAIMAAVRASAGGVTRDDALTAFNEMVGAGVGSASDVMAMLPVVTRAATAANADPLMLGMIGLAGVRNMGLKQADTGQALDMAIKAGQLGGFELKDMSQWLPRLMGAGGNVGLQGFAGLSKILAAAQLSVYTAGSKDEAGNNLMNLLQKINSADTEKDVRKHLGVDLADRHVAARAKGMDSIESFLMITRDVIGKDSRFQALSAQLKGATGDDEKTAILEAQRAIIQGSAIGKIVQDRQAQMSLIALYNNWGKLRELVKSIVGARGTADTNMAVFDDDAALKIGAAREEAANALYASFSKLAPLVGKVADGMTAFMKQFPTLSAALAAAGVALAGLVAMAMTSGAAGLLTGKGAAVATGAAGVASAAGGVASKVLKGAGVLGVGLAAYEATTALMSAFNIDPGKAGIAFAEMKFASNRPASQKLDIRVRAENGNIAASVNERNVRDARRK